MSKKTKEKPLDVMMTYFEQILRGDHFLGVMPPKIGQEDLKKNKGVIKDVLTEMIEKEDAKLCQGDYSSLRKHFILKNAFLEKTGQSFIEHALNSKTLEERTGYAKIGFKAMEISNKALMNVAELANSDSKSGVTEEVPTSFHVHFVSPKDKHKEE